MSDDDQRRRDTDHADGEDLDTGVPIEELAELELQPSSTFLDFVHRKIDRRIVTSHLFTAGWVSIPLAILHYLAMFFEFLQPNGSNKED